MNARRVAKAAFFMPEENMMEAAQAASTEFRMKSVLVDQELLIVDRLVLAYRNGQHQSILGLAAEISALRAVQEKLDRQTRKAIDNVNKIVGDQNA